MTLARRREPVADPVVAEQVEIATKYAGYIERQHDEIARQPTTKRLRLPADLDYRAVRGLSTEVQQKLNAHRPETLGQARAISGITPAAISLLARASEARVSAAPVAAPTGASALGMRSPRRATAAATRCRRRDAATLPTNARRKLVAYLDLLAKWNRTYNLTAIRDPAQMVTHHLLDSLAILPHPAAARDVCACSTSAAAAACRAFRSRSHDRIGTSCCSMQPEESGVPARRRDRARARQRARRRTRASGLRRRCAVRRRDLAGVFRSRDVRARGRGMSRPKAGSSP